MQDRRISFGRREMDTCLEETRTLLEQHLNDYERLLERVDKISGAMFEIREGIEYSMRDDVRILTELLQQINGGIKVLRVIGYLLTGGLATAVVHAVQAWMTK